MAVKVRTGSASCGAALRGMAVVAGQGMVRCGLVWLGVVRQSR